MTGLTSFTKDPNADLDYTVDWTQWLAAGDTITSSAWASNPSGLALSETNNTGTTASLMIGGGLAGLIYVVTNTIVTGEGRTAVRSFKINVQDQ